MTPERKEQAIEKAQSLRGFYSAANPFGLLLDALLADLEDEALRPETRSQADDLLSELDDRDSSIDRTVRDILAEFAA